MFAFFRRWFRSPTRRTLRRSAARRPQSKRLLLEAPEARVAPTFSLGVASTLAILFGGGGTGNTLGIASSTTNTTGSGAGQGGGIGNTGVGGSAPEAPRGVLQQVLPGVGRIMSPAFSVGSALKNWFASRWFAPRRRPLRAVKKSPFYRLPLRLEQLEGRTVPAAPTFAALSASQWSNLGAAWQNGNLNQNSATLLEGDSVPYRDVFNGLNVGPGNNYVLTIQWQTTNSSLHALDYLTSYDYTWNGGSGSGTTVDGHALDGSGLPSSTPFTTFQIPIDPNINSGPASNFMINGRTPVGSPTNPPNQFFTMYGATVVGQHRCQPRFSLGF
jgi:hypothetical protein